MIQLHRNHERCIPFLATTEGGAADGHQSAMPAYEDILSPDQRWAVISYLHLREKLTRSRCQ